MKKSILKSLQPQTKLLFRFKNSQFNGLQKGADTTATVNTDPTITTTIVVTL